MIPLKLVIMNTRQKDAELAFSSAKTHDFLVKDSKGAPVWRWSAGRAFAQSFFSKKIRGGQEIAFDSSWNQETERRNPAPAGRYALEAELNAIGRFAKLGPLYIEIRK